MGYVMTEEEYWEFIKWKMNRNITIFGVRVRSWEN